MQLRLHTATPQAAVRPRVYRTTWQTRLHGDWLMRVSEVGRKAGER